MLPQIFISHGHKDAATALALVRALEKTKRVRCWIAPRNVEMGTVWADAIYDGIRHSALVVVLASEHSVGSDFVFREVTVAAKHRIPLIPIKLDGTEFPGRLTFYLTGLQSELAPPGARQAWLHDVSRRLVANLTRDAPDDQFGPPINQRIDTSLIPDTPATLYRGRISRLTPACIVILVDCSGSMNQKLGGNTRPRRVVVAEIINNTLRQLENISIGDSGPRHYFDVAVLGYGLGDEGREVRSLLGTPVIELTSIVDFAAHVLDHEVETIPTPRGDVTVHRPVWVRPVANRRGKTVARRAFDEAYRLVDPWVDDHPQSLPPIVVNITDGGYDPDEDPEWVVHRLQELHTANGNALVFNCHLSDARTFRTNATHAEFPADKDATAYPPAMRRLFQQSSVLPPPMADRASELNYEMSEGSRGYVYNADATVLMDFLNVGTDPRPSRAAR